MKKNPTKNIKIKSILEKPNCKLLLQRADRLGDMVLCLPAIESILKTYPHVHITMIGSSKNCQLLKKYPLINNFITFDVDSASSLERKQFINDVKLANYDCYIAFWAHPFFERLAKKGNFLISIGPKTSPLSSFYFSHPIKVAWNDIFFHEIDFNLSLLAPLNLSLKKTCKLYPSSSISKESTTKNCVIFCSSGGSNFSLSEDMIIHLIHVILEKTSYNITLTYGFVEKTSPLLNLDLPRLNNIRDSLDFDQLLDVINLADLYIGPDTGPTHMASFVNTPCIVSFRNVDSLPIRWGPQANIFGIIRFDYKKFSQLKEKKEVDTIFHTIKNLSNLSPLNSKEKRLLHLQHSLRICFECKDLEDLNHKRNEIKTLKLNNWIVFVHIKRKNPIRNFKILYKKYKNNNINVFIVDFKTWYHFIFKIIFNTHLKPKPLFINSTVFENYCINKIKTLVTKFG